jgi:hypothetical protein
MATDIKVAARRLLEFCPGFLPEGCEDSDFFEPGDDGGWGAFQTENSHKSKPQKEYLKRRI